MNSLVTFVNGISVANSKDIADYFGKQHKDVLEAIRNLIAKNSEVKSMITETTYYKRGKQYPQFELNRDGFSLLVMGFTGAKALKWKLKYIEAFNKMEATLKDQDNKAQLLLAIYNGGQTGIVAAKQLTEMEIQEATKPLLNTIEEQKPLVDFADTVSKSCDTILIREMAKLLCDQNISIGEKRLYKLLRHHDVLMSNNEPYQSYVDRGYFYVKESTYTTPYGEKLNKTTLVTPKGQIWVVGKVKEWLAT